ncbi:hypothetical protein [Sulfurovum sp. NBC37-1]|uniref:hypothetical protein n=1 Tax=Sulfurovum sp. (strain NBC37-1) TaxID=387093 RepID=UPI000158799C|nr:hypothetical protein [Sulfurovum sp. NBC37-1]BAF72681.1 hypothetical protein SUN_1734 [Sulfurovum sp. NBC37-1]
MHTIKGTAQIIDDTRIQGWFFDERKISRPLSFELYVNGKKVSDLSASVQRDDLVTANIHPTGDVGLLYKYDIDTLDDVRLKCKEEEFEFVVQEGFASDGEFAKKELCIVHIGMHKTGSTSIQQALSSLTDETFSYFNLHAQNHSIPIYSLFVPKPEHYHIHSRAGKSKEQVKAYNRSVKELFAKHLSENPHCSTFLLSGEDISVLPKPSLLTFRSFLLRFFKKIEIVAYVRSPASYMSSSFQERVKGGAYTFDFENDYPHYRNRFEKFDTVFGKENVQLIHFDPKKMKNSDVVCDFLLRIGLDADCVISHRANESLSLQATAIFYLANKRLLSKKPVSENEKGRIKLLNFLLQKIGDRFLLRQSLIDTVLQKNKSDIKWIEKRMAVSVAEKPLGVSMGIGCEEDLFETAKKALRDMDPSQYDELNEILDVNLLE